MSSSCGHCDDYGVPTAEVKFPVDVISVEWRWSLESVILFQIKGQQVSVHSVS